MISKTHIEYLQWWYQKLTHKIFTVMISKTHTEYLQLWYQKLTFIKINSTPNIYLFAGADIGFAFISIVGIPLAIISTAVTLGEVISANVLEDSFVHVKVNTYDKKCKLITKWLDRMYLFKQDTLRDHNHTVSNSQSHSFKFTFMC